MNMIAGMAVALQGLFTVVAKQVGQECRLIKRKREFTESSLIATFVLGFLQRPCPSWEHLALIARQLGADVTPQAVEQRVTAELRDSLYKLLHVAVGYVLTAEPRMTPLLRKFTSVFVGDSTTIPLGDALSALFPGCGGSHGSGSAAIKLQVIWDVIRGGFRMILEAGKQSDSTSSIMQEIPPAGSLSLFDLGYFSLERFATWQKAGAHYISRGISDLLVWIDGQPQDLHDWLNTQPVGRPVDQWVEVGQARHGCRLTALRAPQEVSARRRQKAHEKAAKKGRQPTARHLATCDWTVFLTSCPEDMLTWKEVVALYRVRWQIELLFKLWKSHNLLEQHRSSDSLRQLVELYARLIAAIVQHWLILTTCWSDDRLSLTKAARLIRDQLPQLILVIADLQQLIDLLSRWQRTLFKLARVEKRRTDPSNPQLLANANLLTYYC